VLIKNLREKLSKQSTNTMNKERLDEILEEEFGKD